MTRRGMTHQEIADHIYETTGQRVTRGAVSSAVSRAGLSRTARRYEDTVPWRVKIEHSKHYAARMLRLLGRQRLGDTLQDTDQTRLDAWLKRMQDEGVVVAYIPESEEGFHYVRPPKGWKDEGIPVDRRTITLADIASGRV
jgi:hypothetical protein